MPATTVIVHDDPEFAEPTLTSLRGAGYDVVAFSCASQPAGNRTRVISSSIRFGRSSAPMRCGAFFCATLCW